MPPPKDDEDEGFVGPPLHLASGLHSRAGGSSEEDKENSRGRGAGAGGSASGATGAAAEGQPHADGRAAAAAAAVPSSLSALVADYADDAGREDGAASPSADAGSAKRQRLSEPS